jgi:uncharacterized YccA/Bax inhibitor family protein
MLVLPSFRAAPPQHHAQQTHLCVPLARGCRCSTPGPLAIGVSLVASGLAAANLLLDLDWIEKASYMRLPGWMEWYGAQSLMMTLVWMYTEVLRLLWMLAGRRDD